MSVLKAVFPTLPHIHESRRRPYITIRPTSSLSVKASSYPRTTSSFQQLSLATFLPPWSDCKLLTIACRKQILGRWPLVVTLGTPPAILIVYEREYIFARTLSLQPIIFSIPVCQDCWRQLRTVHGMRCKLICQSINRSIIYVSTTFILTNNNWTTCFDCYSVILRSFSMVVSHRELCAHWDPKCVYIKT